MTKREQQRYDLAFAYGARSAAKMTDAEITDAVADLKRLGREIAVSGQSSGVGAAGRSGQIDALRAEQGARL